MDFQHDKTWESLTTIIASKLTAEDAWNKFIDYHEKVVPKPYWNTLRQLEINGEQVELVQWLQELLTNNPMPDTVVAIWFGILKVADNNKEIPTIYLIGADTYDKNDSDWASDPSYLPDNRYAQPHILQQIDNIARTDEENYEFFDWILPLAYSTFTLDEIIRTKLDKQLFLAGKGKLFAAAGHDNGDYMELTTLNES